MSTFLCSCLRPTRALLLLLLVGASATPAARESTQQPAEQLAGLVAQFVERDDIVGAELLVLHRGEPILHRAFGFKDREREERMRLDTLFAVRSMTKPVVGMAAHMLIEEGQIELDAPVARYLPSFDNVRSRGITIRHLLTHRSGLPVGFLRAPVKGVAEYASLRELADLSGEDGPSFRPGDRFLYSDAGSDALGAVIETVSGQSLETFVQRRILGPLGMTDTVAEPRIASPGQADRAASRYGGLRSHWRRYWSPADPPVYPFLKGSGGLYSTPADYARFLRFWMQQRSADETTLLSAATINRALAAGSRDAMSAGFVGATVDYGEMWMLYRAANASDGFGFGHGGSDGTHAYAFPDQDLVICLFTQSRDHGIRATFERAIDHLFLNPDAAAFAALVRPSDAVSLEDFTGVYIPGGGSGSFAAIVAVDGTLGFEIPGRTILRLASTDEPDRWTAERAPNDTVQFRRDGGRVVGLTLTRGGAATDADRFVPDASLPTVDDIVALRTESASPEALRALLPLRVRSRIEAGGQTFRATTTYADGDRAVTEVAYGAAGTMRVWISDQRVWRQLPGEAVTELRGPERFTELEGSLLSVGGDWSRLYRDITTLARETVQGRDVFRVRLVPSDGFATTRLVDAERGTILEQYSLALLPGAGLQGVTTRYADFRDIGGGLLLPFAETISFPGAPAAAFRVIVDGIDVNLAVDLRIFEPGRP